MEIRLIRKEKEYRLTRNGDKLVLRSAEKERIYDAYTLRGVAVQGFCTGDLLILYSGEGKQKYELAEDCAPETVDKLFEGVKRFQARKQSSTGVVSRRPDWRREMQEPEKLKRMLRIGRVLNAAGFTCAFVSMFVAVPALIVMCMAVLGVSTLLCLIYPQYFSIMDWRGYRRAGYTSDAAQMELGIVLPAVMLMFRTMRDFSFPDWLSLIVIGLTAGAAACVLLFLLLRDVRQNPRLLGGIFLTAALAAAGTAGQINHLANFSVEPPGIYMVENTDTHRSGRGARSYYCEIKTEQGKLISLWIPVSEYQNMERGDNVLVYIGEGALGIEYAYYVGNLNGK